MGRDLVIPVDPMTSTPSATPPAAPLDMPTQALSRHPGTRFAIQEPAIWLARLITFGGALALTAAAGWQMYLIISVNGTNALLWLLTVLFTITFGWIALSATAAVAGLFLGRDRRRATPDAELQGKTVLLMPIYNEDPASACAALFAMAEDLARKGLAGHFEIFILSDTRNPEIQATELAAVQCLRDRLADTMPVWYRRRSLNTAKKAGNIRDFINSWGARYDYMVILDADSLICGDTLATLVREMDADPSTGILQTLPRLHGGETLYARLQQFAGVVHGPVFARGLSAWQGHDGNYWGHNAIVRIRAFAESAGLPRMPGPRPFGGEILSHDFVEAALIRRAGWTVRMLPNLAGSWEECPPTLLDAAARDRRWAQGNVQHLGIVTTKGLRWPSRVHMLMGVMNYLTSPLWLGMVAVGLLLSTRIAWQQIRGSAEAGQLLAGWPVFDSERMIGLFIVTMALLLVPKLLGLACGLFRRELRHGPGRFRLVMSAVMELVFSILHAPIFMLLHSQHLSEIVRGKDSGWPAQQRQGSGVQWRQLLMRHCIHTLTGVVVTVHLVWLSSPLLYWMLPIVTGLVLAVPLSALSGSRRFGRLLARYGLLGTPEEMAPPVIMQRRRAFLESCTATIDAVTTELPHGPASARTEPVSARAATSCQRTDSGWA